MSSQESPLAALRRQITAVDENLLELIAKRRLLAIDIAQIKKQKRLPIRDEEREKALLENLVERGGALSLDSQFVTRIFKSLIEYSVFTQQQLLAHDAQELTTHTRVAFLGPKGSYSHVAARHFAAQHIDQMVECGCHKFNDIFKLVDSGQADYGILPIENTSSGSINDIYDLLQTTNLAIIYELFTPINHCLLTNGNTPLDEIEQVFSHPQPAQQCSQFLEKHPQWKIIYTESSSAAMEMVETQQSAQYAALGSEAGGSLYGLTARARNLANQKENVTRFIVVARKARAVPPEQPAKTSLIMATGQQPGALVDALLVLRKHQITMTKLESRPITGNPWEEMFYLDVQANEASDEMQSALAELKTISRFIKVLGCYPSESRLPQRR